MLRTIAAYLKPYITNEENSEIVLIPPAVLVVIGGLVAFLLAEDMESVNPFWVLIPFTLLFIRFGIWVWRNGILQEHHRNLRNLDMPPGGWPSRRYRNADSGPGVDAAAAADAAGCGDVGGGGCGGGGE